MSTATHQIDKPQPCFRRVKEGKGGVWVAARIHRTCHCTIHGGDDNAPHPWRMSCDRYPQLEADINGKPRDPYLVWATRGEKISEGHYLYLIDDREHAVRYRPESPEANPRQPVDFNSIPPPQF